MEPSQVKEKLAPGASLRALKHHTTNAVRINRACDTVQNDVSNRQLTHARLGARFIIDRLRQAGAFFSV